MAISTTAAQSPDGVLQMPSTDGFINNAFTASFTTAPVAIQFHKAFALQFVFSGSNVASPPVGNVQISGSLDGRNFCGLEALTTFSNTGSFIRNFDAQAVKYVQAFVSRSAGSSNISGSVFLACI